ncbi:MAG: caspase family protein [Leptospiraceae bacterium]|nr:caspase family protein [Leptospiraceae bacterium]
MNHSKKNPVRVFWIGILYALCAIGLSAQEENAPTPETNNPEPIVVPAEPTPSKPVTTDTTPSSGKRSKRYNLKSKSMKLTEIDEDGDAINIGKRYAIAIGINDYSDPEISDLSKARNDAKATGKILKEIGQFDQVFVMTDDIGRNDPENLYPTKLNIEEKLESVLRFATPDDLIVFFFSGHGISDIDDNGYLVTVDTSANRKYGTALKVDWIVYMLKEKKIKKSLLILDACRDVLYTSKSSNRDSIKNKEYSEAEVAATFYSTKSGDISHEDDESDYGVFTKYLIYGMEGRADDNKDGVVSFSELEHYVGKGVKEWSVRKNKQQKPFTKIYGEKTGDLAITAANNPDKSLADKKVAVEVSQYVWRSAVIPGWGQWHNENTIKSSLFFVTFFGTAGLMASSYTKFKAAEKDYLSSSQSVLLYPANPNLVGLGYLNAMSKQSQAQSQANQVKSISIGLAAIYLINLVDAYFFSDKSSTAFFEQKNSGLFLYTYIQPTTVNQSYSYEKVISASYTWRF